MLRAVVDTNIFVSGLLNGPSCKKIIKALKEGRFILVISPQILDELIGVISRPKFHNIIIRETAEKLIEAIKAQAILVKPSQRFNIVKDDPDDNRFLEAASESAVDFIVSRDNHLLSLKFSTKIPIIPPEEFIKELTK